MDSISDSDREASPRPSRSVRLHLPVPPSANRYWRHSRSGVYIAPDAMAYRSVVTADVINQLGGPTNLEGKLKVDIALTMPTNHRADLDNRIKQLLDAMQKAGVYLDDSQIEDLHIVRVRPNRRPGAADVCIEEIEE